MASLALVDATTYVHGYDATTDLNQISLAIQAEELDATTFGSGGYRTRKGGLKTVEAELNGFWDSATAGEPDPESFPDLGVADRVVTMSPTGAEASVAYLYQAGKFTYQLGGQVGELLPFTLGCVGTNAVGVVRGQIAKAKGSVSATGALGSGLNLGNVGASQYLYGSFHIFGTPGTTITVVLESDDNAGFSSATTRATLGPLTTAGGTWATRVAGPLSETHYRYRVTAITGTFEVAGAIGIG